MGFEFIDDPKAAPGQIEPGNIDLLKRPVVKNADGTISTVRSISANFDGAEVLIPTVSDDGRILSDEDAIAAYKRTGRHLGKFDSPQTATAYAQSLHNDQARLYGSAPGGVEFLEDASEPAGAGEITRRFLDPNYQPTLAEFKVYQAARDNRSLGERIAGGLETAGGAIAGLAGTVARGVKGAIDMARDPEKNDPIMTAFEGVARGTAADMDLAKKLLPSERFAGTLNFDQFAYAKQHQLRNEKFKGRMLTPENAAEYQATGAATPEMLAQWRKEYDQEFLPQSAYEQFMEKRASELKSIQRSQSRTSIITDREADISPEFAEAQGLVTSPLFFVPFGKALTPAKTFSRALMAKTLEGAGKTFEWVGEKTVQAAKLPERAAGAMARAATGSEDAAAKATEQVATGVAGVSTLPVKAAGRTVSAVGQGAEAAGRAVGESPSSYGVFDRIRFDAKAPEWMRRAANAARPLDPALSLAGTAVKGAVEGAAIGAVLGGLADGEEGAASGAGGGLALGGGGAVLGRLASGGKYRAALEDHDVARWLATKSPEEVTKLRNLNLSRQQAVQLADVERLARGVVEPGRAGDVEFRYVTDKEFSTMFGGIGKGAQTVEGDRPVVFVNTGYRGNRSTFHEVAHALDALDAFAPQRQQLNRLLFDQTAPGGGPPLTRGIYSAADLAEFGQQYRSRLSAPAKAEWDLLTPESRQARLLSEVRAESFANYLGGPRSLRVGGSLRARVADKLLLADNVSFLGKLRRGLEGMGVRFDASGAPSELFVRNGKPITNTPAVDAALRDYLRAKDQITRRLTAGDDEAPDFVIRPQDLLSKGNQGLLEVYKGSDLIAKNPDGTVKMMGGVPVLLSEREIRRLQTNRAQAMMDALATVPNLGEPNSLKQKPNGAWEGNALSDAQLAKMLSLPDDVLPPSMKEKLKALNDLARAGDGSQIVLDYNAALKGGKYSSGIAPTTRAAVPLTFNISKAGNFFMVTLDTTHFFRKLGEWRRSKPKAFAAWGGDTEAFLRDVFAYLDNHVNGRSGSVNLDPDAATAVMKKNVINDFFNVPKGVGNEDANPIQLNTRGGKDNLIRSRRFDRINRITPGAGDRFPIRYELQKKNFLPAMAAPPGAGAAIAPAAQQKHLRAQTEFDLARRITGPPNLAQWLAAEYADTLERLNRHRPGSRTAQLQRLAATAAATTPSELNGAMSALMSGGQTGAREYLERMAKMVPMAEFKRLTYRQVV